MLLKGLKKIKNKNGKIVKLELDLTKIENEAINDLIDALLVEERKDEETVPFDTVVQQLDKKHGILRD